MSESVVTPSLHGESKLELRLTQSTAIFVVADVRASIDYYRNVLGFEGEWIWGDPPNFGAVEWGNIQIMFGLNPDFAAAVKGHPHFFKANDVQALYERHKAAGATIIEDIENKPWGVREYTVRDINGYHLRFAGNPSYERPEHATDSIPPEIRIVRRMPTIDEYIAMRRSVKWGVDEKRSPEALKASLFGITAIDTHTNQAVGMLRVCGDGLYFTIWDVVVMPTYQGKKIGSAMMATAMSELRKIGAKGAFVGLFTPKPQFYEHFEFRMDGGMHASL